MISSFLRNKYRAPLAVLFIFFLSIEYSFCCRFFGIYSKYKPSTACGAIFPLFYRWIFPLFTDFWFIYQNISRTVLAPLFPRNNLYIIYHVSNCNRQVIFHSYGEYYTIYTNRMQRKKNLTRLFEGSPSFILNSQETKLSFMRSKSLISDLI